MKHGEFEISDDLVELVRHRWPVRYQPGHPDALGREPDRNAVVPRSNYRGVLCCGSEHPREGDPFAECGARIVPDDFRGLLNHLLTFHGYRMDGNQYDNHNRILRHASADWQ